MTPKPRIRLQHYPIVGICFRELTSPPGSSPLIPGLCSHHPLAWQPSFHIRAHGSKCSGFPRLISEQPSGCPFLSCSVLLQESFLIFSLGFKFVSFSFSREISLEKRGLVPSMFETFCMSITLLSLKKELLDRTHKICERVPERAYRSTPTLILNAPPTRVLFEASCGWSELAEEC